MCVRVVLWCCVWRCVSVMRFSVVLVLCISVACVVLGFRVVCSCFVLVLSSWIVVSCCVVVVVL